MNPERIKSIVKKNFDASVEAYETFEQEYSLFRTLARTLADFCGIEKSMSVLDVGCGTGASTFYLCEIASSVVGIDLSEGMVGAAQKNARPNTRFIVGDAERLSSHVTEKFDAVLYNATIFLVPDTQKTLHEAKMVLKSGGVCGASFLVSLFAGDADIIGDARRSGLAQDGTFVRGEDIRAGFEEKLGRTEEKTVDMPMDVLEAEAFYSIQAQSASLFPKNPYEERASLVSSLFSKIGKEHEGVEMRWVFLKASV